MRRILLPCLVSGVLLPLTGCKGAYNQNVTFYQEMMASVQELTEAFAAVTDQESVKAALPRINAALDRYEKLPVAAAALPQKLTASENRSLQERFLADWPSKVLRLGSAARMAELNSRNNPDIKAAAQRLQDATQGIKKGMAVNAK